jgi:hypothetical protein
MFGILLPGINQSLAPVHTESSEHPPSVSREFAQVVCVYVVRSWFLCTQPPLPNRNVDYYHNGNCFGWSLCLSGDFYSMAGVGMSKLGGWHLCYLAEHTPGELQN